jgi:hypothetical protein
MNLGFREGTEFFDTVTAWASSPFRGNESPFLSEKRERMCKEGVKQFGEYCLDPANKTAFLAHIIGKIGPPRGNDGCRICRKPFFEILKSIRTPDDLSRVGHG